MSHEPQPVLLFDAGCPLCRRTVQCLIRRDRHGRLRFAALDGAEGRLIRAALGAAADPPDSLILVADWSLRLEGPWFLRADGALRALALLPGTSWAVRVLRFVPPSWLEAAYRAVAAARRRRGAA
ncbi:MAG: thiol-disulfide oxidoreductase DCC family protein, partial [Opitutaceae bacterium]